MKLGHIDADSVGPTVVEDDSRREQRGDTREEAAHNFLCKSDSTKCRTFIEHGATVYDKMWREKLRGKCFTMFCTNIIDNLMPTQWQQKKIIYLVIFER